MSRRGERHEALSTLSIELSECGVSVDTDVQTWIKNREGQREQLSEEVIRSVCMLVRASVKAAQDAIRLDIEKALEKHRIR